MRKDPVKPLCVVMGVSGSGKTTIAQQLARQLRLPFQEGDDLHPPENIEKMHSGLPLNDDERAPWLEKCHDWLAEHVDSGGVLTCSALKKSYRNLLLKNLDVVFIYLRADQDVIAARLKGRRGHFMPPSLLPSQIATLEEPGPEENVIMSMSSDPPQVVLKKIIKELVS